MHIILILKPVNIIKRRRNKEMFFSFTEKNITLEGFCCFGKLLLFRIILKNYLDALSRKSCLSVLSKK